MACGNNGTFIKSTDGGITWDVSNLLLGDSLNLNGLNFLDSDYGMVCGENGFIFKTTDGGNSWTKLITATTEALSGIAIIDTNLAIAIGLGGTILRTADGGINWLPIPFETPGDLTSIRNLHSDFITITGHNGLLYKSIDSGSMWKQIVIKTDTNVIGNNINGQVFYDTNTAIVVGDLGGIFTTNDGGKNWANRSVENISAATLHSIDGKDPSGGIYATVGEYGAIFYSTNTGNAWSKVNLGIADTLNSISFFDRLNAMAVGRGGIIISTSDGGANWNFLPSKPMTNPLNGVAFPKGDTSLGIAVGLYGTIMRTTNGGVHWDIIPRDSTNDLHSVTFLNSSEVCAVGQFGTILRSNDAGLNWKPQASGTLKYLKSVSFLTPTFGWAVGDSGIVLSTVDGGSTWTIHPFSKKRFFSGVAFPDSLHGYICSDHGVYISIDGGVTWSDPDDVTYYLNCTSISSPSVNEVRFTYLPCDFITDLKTPGLLLMPGGIMRSHDGGKNWINTNFNTLLSSVFFTDDLHGTAVGYYRIGRQDFGFVTHTTDGGTTWKEQDSHTYEILYGVAFGTNKAGTAVGTGGNIIRITTDE